MRFEEFKDMLKSGDLEQIRPHLAFEMMPADSPKTERYNDCPYIAIQDMYAIPIIWASLKPCKKAIYKRTLWLFWNWLRRSDSIGSR